MTDARDAIVDSVQDIRPGIRILRLRVAGAPVAWEAGQYMELGFQGFPSRPYSIASAPHSKILEFHIRSIGSGGASQHAVSALKPGDHLTLRGPFGRATHNAANREPLLLIAGGMGISPLKAILEDALHHRHPGPLRLYWGGQTANDLYIADDLRALAMAHNVDFIEVTQDSTTPRHGLVGDAVADDLADLSHYQIYLSGPPKMVASIVPMLLARHAHPARIHTDDSHAQSLLPKPGTGGPP